MLFKGNSIDKDDCLFQIDIILNSHKNILWKINIKEIKITKNIIINFILILNYFKLNMAVTKFISKNLSKGESYIKKNDLD